jgi:hypothetical protein
VAPRLPKASLKYPTLAAANLDVRESRTAIAVSGTGTFEDERPGRSDEAPAGSRKPAMIAMIVGGLALAAGGLVFALKPSSKPATPEPAAAVANPAAPTQAAVAAPATPPPVAAPKPAPAEAPKPAAAAEPSAEPAKPSRSRRHRSSESSEEPKADPLHRAIPLPAETPAEIKPFPTN